MLKREATGWRWSQAATSGSTRFFLGTDSAPHRGRAEGARESAAPAATPRSAALELYAEAFDAAGALDKLEGFASFHGPASTACRATRHASRLRRAPGLPEALPFGEAELKPLRGGETLAWRLVA